MSADLMSPHAVDEETLAAFADGRLEEKANAGVRAHLGDCALCRDTLDVIAGAQSEEIIPRQAPIIRSDRFRYAVPLAAAAAVAIFFLPPVQERIDKYRTGGTSELVAASEYVSKRTHEARLSADFPHRPAQRLRGAGDDDRHRGEFELERAVATILADVPEDSTSVRKLRARAMAELLDGKRNAAVATMEKAVRLAGDPDASMLSDLAAMYLERGQEGDAEIALRHAQNAWKREQTPPVAWNLALAHERTGRTVEAKQMWNEYVRLDPSSAWANEARDHIADLTHDR
jgi:Flp pilus assembly protein TadD